MLRESVTESAFGLTDVEETTSGAMDTVIKVGGCTGEPLLDLESLSWALDGGEMGDVDAETVTGDGDGEVQKGEGGIGDGPGEFEVGVKG
eukprot:g32690.t1